MDAEQPEKAAEVGVGAVADLLFRFGMPCEVVLQCVAYLVERSHEKLADDLFRELGGLAFRLVFHQRDEVAQLAALVVGYFEGGMRAQLQHQRHQLFRVDVQPLHELRRNNDRIAAQRSSRFGLDDALRTDQEKGVLAQGVFVEVDRKFGSALGAEAEDECVDAAREAQFLQLCDVAVGDDEIGRRRAVGSLSVDQLAEREVGDGARGFLQFGVHGFVVWRQM